MRCLDLILPAKGKNRTLLSRRLCHEIVGEPLCRPAGWTAYGGQGAGEARAGSKRRQKPSPQILFLLRSVASHFSKEFPSLVSILCLNAKLNNPPAPQSCLVRPGGAEVLGKAAEQPPRPHPVLGCLNLAPRMGPALAIPAPSPSRESKAGFRLLESGKEFLSVGGYSRLD